MCTFAFLVPNDDHNAIELNNDISLHYISNEWIKITWNKDSLIPQSLAQKIDLIVTLNIQLAKIDTETGSTQVLKNLASNVANNGQYRVIIPSEYDEVSGVVVQITIANIGSESLLKRSSKIRLLKLFNLFTRVTLYGRMFLVVSSISGIQLLSCELWYRIEPDRVWDLIPCPPNTSLVNSSFTAGNMISTKLFHPTAKICYRENIHER